MTQIDLYNLTMTGAERELLRDALGKMVADHPSSYGSPHLLNRINGLQPQPAHVGKIARSYPSGQGYQPKTGQPCHCRVGVQRSNCPDCEGTGQRIDFAAIRSRSRA